MKKQNLILSAALAAVFSASTAFAEAEVTGKIVHESATFTESGQGIGAISNWNTTTDTHGKDVFKTATQAKIFIDGDLEEVNEGATYHVELNAFNNNKNTTNYDDNESYTQRDALREAYVDTEVNDWSIRTGKQQVVWGTADGMKLLDAINPTDYSEMAQNQMEDSRIPVWMINAEKDLETGGSVQLILSQAKANKIAGLNSTGDQGNAFVMKGVDSITGKVNGFLNIAPALGKVANFFVRAAGGGSNTATNLYDKYEGATVNEFATGDGGAGDFVGLDACVGATTANCLYQVAQDTDADSVFGGPQGSNDNVTNLIDASNSSSVQENWSVSNPNSMFEYMDETSFASFYAFSNMTSEYRKKYPSASEANSGLRYKNSTSSGINYSFNYLNHYDSNPYVDIHWEDTSGNKLTVAYEDENYASDGNALDCGGQSCASEAWTVVVLKDSDGSKHTLVESVANLVFEEKLNKINSLGGSFDMATETSKFGPVVFRGEFLYDQGVKTPIIDKSKLRIGDAAGALTSVDADFFKYVLGADITVMTNMMISGQFIQIRNLDFVDEQSTPTVGGVEGHITDARYTGDAAVLHLSNGLQKAKENKEFVSIFLSKPFGASGEHRWNNILMLEDGGGRWNRLDAEFSIDDDTQATVEYNKYWGDANTQFGQLEKSSNIQVGVTYSF